MYKLTILQPYLCPLTKTRTCIYIHNTTACEKLNVRIVVNGEQWSEQIHEVHCSPHSLLLPLHTLHSLLLCCIHLCDYKRLRLCQNPSGLDQIKLSFLKNEIIIYDAYAKNIISKSEKSLTYKTLVFEPFRLKFFRCFLFLCSMVHLSPMSYIQPTQKGDIPFFKHKTRTVALLLKRETTKFIINLHLHFYQKSSEFDDFSFHHCLALKLSKQVLIQRLQSLDFVFKVCGASLLLLPVFPHCLSVPT